MKDEISAEQANTYVQEGGMHCPACGSEGIEGDFVTTGGGEASQGMRCLKCDARWTDIYTLNFVLIDCEAAGKGVSS